MQHSTIKSNELQQIMSYCYGTEHYYKIPAYSFKYTDGIKTFCEKADAYWLLDIVASVSRHYKQMHEDFIIIDIIVGEDNLPILQPKLEKWHNISYHWGTHPFYPH